MVSKKAAVPYSKLKIVRKYISYYFRSSTKSDIHSPFVYELVDQVVHKRRHPKTKLIEAERKRLTNSKAEIDFVDYGKAGNLFRKKVADIAKRALKPKKYAHLLRSIVYHYKAKNVLELGTSLGITTAYLAADGAQITTMEGDPNVANIAQNVWGQLGFKNIDCIVGNFDKTLDQLNGKYDVIYIDGNHSYEPTLRYFKHLHQHAHEDTLFIFDDIHYSKDMERAWNDLQEKTAVTLSVDLFFIGIVSLSTSYTKQHFEVRF